MKPEVMPRDTERLVVDFLDPEIGDVCTVGIGVPEGWTSDSELPHLQVVLDGQFVQSWPVATVATIRLVSRAASTTEAKALCGLAFGLLCAHNGDGVIAGTRPLTGVIPARDPATDAELAAATVRVTVRTEAIPGS